MYRLVTKMILIGYKRRYAIFIARRFFMEIAEQNETKSIKK